MPQSSSPTTVIITWQYICNKKNDTNSCCCCMLHDSMYMGQTIEMVVIRMWRLPLLARNKYLNKKKYRSEQSGADRDRKRWRERACVCVSECLLLHSTVSSQFYVVFFSVADTNDSDKMLTPKQLNVSNSMLETRRAEQRTIETHAYCTCVSVTGIMRRPCARDYFSCFEFHISTFLSWLVHSVFIFLFFIAFSS